MSATRLDEIREIARASLMPDFFAVRIDEENLFGELQQLIGRIKLDAAPYQKMKAIAAASPSAMAFIDSIKAANLWASLRDVLVHLPR